MTRTRGTASLGDLGTAGASTRARRDRARLADRSRGSSAAGLFVVLGLGAALWVRRLLQGAPGPGLIGGAVVGVVAVGVGIVVASRLDLSASANELTRRLNLEVEVAHRLRAAGAVVLHDRTIAGSPPLSHLVVTPGSVLVVVDASCARQAPWRRSVRDESATTPVWRAWVDASAAAIALRDALAAGGPAGPVPAVEAAVVTDVRGLPPWADRLPIHSLRQVPQALLPAAGGPPAAPCGEAVSALALRMRALTSPATTTNDHP